MGSAIGMIRRNWQITSPPIVPKSDDALKFGILGAANIAPMALINPAKSHPEVIIQAVAARDADRARAYAKKHGIPQVMDSYQALLDSPSIDAVYIPLPNALHLEWALKALAKGKHVLLEKPSVSNAEEAAILFRSSVVKRANAPVLLDAFHYRFQPAWQHFLSLCDFSNVENAKCVFKVPAIIFKKDDIRFKYDLAGGALMDMGGYLISALRGVFAEEPESCLECTTTNIPPPYDELCDSGFKSRYRFPNGGIGEIEGDLQGSLLSSPIPRLEVTHRSTALSDESLPEGQEKTRVRRLTFNNFMGSNIWHRIDIEDAYTIRQTSGGKVIKSWKTRNSRKVYTFEEAGIDQPGEDYWLSYRHQLEQFVNRIRGREGSGLWVDGEDSIAQMKAVDMTYEKSGLPLRRTSEFRLMDS